MTKSDGNEGVGGEIWWKQICKFETTANSANSLPQVMLAGDNYDSLPLWIIDDIDHINVKSNFDTENNWSIIGQNCQIVKWRSDW